MKCRPLAPFQSSACAAFTATKATLHRLTPAWTGARCAVRYLLAGDRDGRGGTEDGIFTDQSIGVTYQGPGELPITVEDYARAFADMHRELYQMYVTEGFFETASRQTPQPATVAVLAADADFTQNPIALLVDIPPEHEFTIPERDLTVTVFPI